MGREARSSKYWGGRALGVQVEHLNSWVLMARVERKYDPSRWKIVLEIIQMVFAKMELVMD